MEDSFRQSGHMPEHRPLHLEYSDGHLATSRKRDESCVFCMGRLVHCRESTPILRHDRV